MQTQAIEDYLKVIYELQAEHGKVPTTALAERLDVAPASVTGMIKKLASLRLVLHEPYQGVELTKAGERIALRILRQHRLVESYLAESLGVPWDQVHGEADKWEHVLSEDLEARIDSFLGHPTIDPHGAPIPDPDGVMQATAHTRLHEVAAGRSARVAEVSDHDPDLLRRLGAIGLYPGTHLQVMAADLASDAVVIRIDADEHTLARAVAQHISVALLPDQR